MAKVRRIYTREFKLEAVKLVTEKGYSVAEAARSLGRHENLIRSWKKELIHDADFASREEAQAAIFEYIEVFDNGQRRHSSLEYVSPAEYEQSE
jgi:transposase-like protein